MARGRRGVGLFFFLEVTVASGQAVGIVVSPDVLTLLDPDGGGFTSVSTSCILVGVLERNKHRRIYSVQDYRYRYRSERYVLPVTSHKLHLIKPIREVLYCFVNKQLLIKIYDTPGKQ